MLPITRLVSARVPWDLLTKGTRLGAEARQAGALELSCGRARLSGLSWALPSR